CHQARTANPYHTFSRIRMGLMDTVKALDVVQGRQQGVELHGEYRYEDVPTEGTVACDWQLSSGGVRLNVKGRLHARLVLECARCLGSYTVPVDVNIRERYVFDSYVEHGSREREITADDYYETVDEYGELDLKDLAHQFLVMEAEAHQTC